MSNRGGHRGGHRQARTITLPWRKACATIPAVALISGGIALASPAEDLKSVAASKASPALVVPGTALAMPAVPTRTGTQGQPGLVLPAGTVPGSSTPVALDSMGIPSRALEAYRRGASLVGAADPACHIDWALLAAIGRVESDHARFGGNQLDSAGVAQPGIIGVALDGTNGTARITDTDHGLLDRDTTYDRAVGPMQFIPSTWRVVGVDADGRGVKNPQDMADAAAATAVYLCSGPGDLTRPGDLRAAIWRYNPSDSYVRTVIAIADAYRHGVSALPASDLPAANPTPSQAGGTAARTDKPARNTPVSRSTSPTGQAPAVTPSAPATTATAPPSSTTTPPPPGPALPLPTLPSSNQSSTPSGLPSLPLTQQICTLSALGVKICTLVPR
jgi:Transglycosylase SLT domain